MTNLAASQGRVLLADDEAAFARVVARALRRAGFDVTVVADGPSGAQAIASGRFDVVLSDMNMPGSTGMDLLRLVRAYHLDTSVLLMSGTPRVEDALTAIRLGALQYLCKPFPLETVVALVARAAKLRRLATHSPAGDATPKSGTCSQLRSALDRTIESMWMEYQPIVRVSDRVVVAYEALLRTNEPELPHTSAVLEAAEQLGSLAELGRAVQCLVAETLAGIPDGCAMFVNVHADELRDESLGSKDAPLSHCAGRVVLQVAERAGFESARELRARVELLREMGYRIAVDDLGVGFAGLASFATLEPEFVKLDTSLIRGIHASSMRQNVVRSMIALCQDMGRCVIAEGVEAPEERDQLIELGCDWMQGYLFSKPARGFASPSWD